MADYFRTGSAEEEGRKIEREREGNGGTWQREREESEKQMERLSLP